MRALTWFTKRKTKHLAFNVAHRLFHRSLSRLVVQQPKEVSIKMPWGCITGLHWNESTSAIPFLCIHGWKDNAATFNRLIPLMLERSNNYQFLAIDLPGHGHSSHYPPGMLYQAVDQLVMIRRVLTHFGWAESKGVHLMGHSIGAILSFLFAASHPKITDCLIAIDSLVPVTFDHADLVGMYRVISKGILNLESQMESTRMSYEKEELRKRFILSHMGINDVTADILLTRGIVECPQDSGKWKFSHDLRVHYMPLMGISEDQIESFAKLFRSNLLHLKADNGVHYYSEYLEGNIHKWLAQDNSKNLRFVNIKDTNHHLHIEKPETIISDIMSFLDDNHKLKMKNNK